MLSRVFVACRRCRDKYMFHQANVISTTWTNDPNDRMYVTPRPTNDPSLLEYWYTRVLAELATFLNTDVFPVQVKSRMGGELRSVTLAEGC